MTGCPHADTLSTDGRLVGSSSGMAVLLIDDNEAVARALEIAFTMAGHRLDAVSGPTEAESRLALTSYDAVLLDMNFSVGAANGEEGLGYLRRIMAADPAACVVVITAHSGIRIAVEAMQAGARDFVMKPWRNADLIRKVAAAVSREGLAPAARPAPVAAAAPPPRIIGDSEAIHRLRDLIRRVGPTSASVAVVGRSGTGRSLAARAIHAASESTGVEAARLDLRDQASWSRLVDASGTFILRNAEFLDAVDQDRLLELLPGHLRCISIVGTSEKMIPALRRRLATAEVAVPSLATRGDDVVLLARHFALAAAERFGRYVPRLTEAAEAAIRSTVWRDEVRGLALALERASLLCEDGIIDAAAVSQSLPAALETAKGDGSLRSDFDLSDAERAMIEAALREHRQNVTQAAVALGISRGSLYRRMARYGL